MAGHFASPVRARPGGAMVARYTTLAVLLFALAFAACDGGPSESPERDAKSAPAPATPAPTLEQACLLPEPPARPVGDRAIVEGPTGEPIALDAVELFEVEAAAEVRWEPVTLDGDSLEYVSQHALALGAEGVATTATAAEPGRYRVAALVEGRRLEVDLDIRRPDRREFVVRGVALSDLFGETGGPEFDVSPEDPVCLEVTLDHALAGPVRAGANWISVSPANFMTVSDPSPVWGAQYADLSLTDDEFYRALVDAAHARGLQVLQAEQDAPDFKLAGGWDNLPAQQQRAEWWEGWFDEWTSWVVERAARAEAAGVDAFAPFVWTSFVTPAEVYPAYVERWTAMVSAIREVYSGELVSTALVFVDERFLPLVGLFDIVIVFYDSGGIVGSELIADPLSPTVPELRAAFEQRMEQAVRYLSGVDAEIHFSISAASNSGQGSSEGQAERAGYVVDFQEQAAYYEAFFQAVEGMQWVSGIWIERMDWFDQFARPPEGWYFDATVENSPRSKPAEAIIARWFLP